MIKRKIKVKKVKFKNKIMNYLMMEKKIVLNVVLLLWKESKEIYK